MQTLERARAKRDIGILLAVNHADNAVPDWNDVAYEFVRLFAARSKGVFIGHDIVLASREWGLAEAPDARAWGGPIRRAVKESLIVRVGYTAAPHRHCSPVPLYRAS